MAITQRYTHGPNLGFGYMRLPMADGQFVDLNEVNRMVDEYLAQGYYYFDTAYIYNGSEEALRKSLVERYPRDRFWITTKCSLTDMPDPSGMRKQQEESFRRLGVDYVDAYFLHGLSGQTIKTAYEFDAWGFLKELKESGKAKHIGFSFHGTPEELDEILSKQPEVELVQLQINYLDWDSPSVRARDLYTVARKHGKWISIMEPTKGGLLCSEDTEAGKMLKAADPDSSVASWAFRFDGELDGILAILSGMGNLEQLYDNSNTLQNFKPLNKEEHAMLVKAAEMINATPRLPCTGCRYCTTNCPQSLPVPMYIKFYNDMLMYKTEESLKYIYHMVATDKTAASNCLGCGSCERHCPQHIEITKYIKEIAEKFDN